MLSRFIFILSVLHTSAVTAQSVSYIANEGVCINVGEKAILVDALHTKYSDDYLFPSQDQIEGIYNQRPPYENIVACLVTHFHKDHFDQQLILKFLRKNSDAVLIAPPQVIGSLEDTTNLSSKIYTVPYRIGKKSVFKIDDLTVTALPFPHTYPIRHSSVQNVAYIIRNEEFTFLHAGDAIEESNYWNEYGIKNMTIDVALLPVWYLASNDSKDLISRSINAKQLVAIHVGPTDLVGSRKNVKFNFPGARVFGIPGEIVEINSKD